MRSFQCSRIFWKQRNPFLNSRLEIALAFSEDSLAVRTGADDIRSASEWLARFCSERDVPADQLFRLDLCLNEVMANIASHGGESALDSAVLLAIVISVKDECTEATLTVSDSGKPFNPLTAVATPQAQSLEDAVPGGLGLTMIACYSDQLDYNFSKRRNHLKITVRWTRSPS